MKFDFNAFREKWKRKILPNIGLVFTCFMLFLFALAGLGPLLRHYSPDEQKLNAEAAVKAQEFVQTATSGNSAPPLSLDSPHRANDQVGEWMGLQVAELLNFTPATYDDHIRAASKFADDHARTDFHSFIINSNVLDTLQKNNFQLRGSTEGNALLLNTGLLEGRYRWLFEIPVLMTFLPVDAKSYSDTQHLSQHIIVTAQVGRISHETNADEMQIESFSARKNPDYSE